MAELNKPFPPGDYPVVVVGSGPGAIQISYCLSRLGIEHAVISADDRPGGMFQRFPKLERLISWSKPHAPVERETSAYLRYDWNSLLAEKPEHQAVAADFMDGSSYFPARAEMEASIAAFAERAGVTVRYECTWEATTASGEGFTLTTSDGEYRCRIPVFAIGMAQPWRPPVPGLEDVPHYADSKRPHEYEDKRVFIVGKRNSGFELADGLLPWARQIILASPSPPVISVVNRTVAAARARYMQPYEDHILGGGNFVMDAAIERIARSNGAYRVAVRGTTVPGDYTLEVDEVIAATGFRVPLGDLRELGVATFMQDRVPALTPYWESVTVPGMYFAGTVSQGAAGLQKYGIPSTSAAVLGFRYNALVLARHLAEKYFGVTVERRVLVPHDVVAFLLGEATRAAELWNQQAYLARVVSFDPEAGIRDEGIVPLAHFVDADGPPAIAMTIEANPHADIYPTVYVRVGSRVEEHQLPTAPLHDFEMAEHRKQLDSLVTQLL
ncbi:MAG TPA: NAD(P)-binding domain-containing protein [Actinomycetota bacterium]|nr:NAD(P)-binding domain-containing protein [Actinomycetota bacterium]